MNQKVSQNSLRWTSFKSWEIIILMLIWVIASQFAPLNVDAVRDIYQANAIATGAAFPLTGPQLANTIHLGPLWFYILAVPAAVFSTWSSMVFLGFFLSALKFWLAYVFGRKLHSTQLGIMFALFLAMPSWSSMQLVIWTHTIVLETSLLLYLLSLRRSSLFPGAASWLLTGFCFSLALHAHPTALPFIFLLTLAWRPLMQRWYWIVCLVLGIAVPFLPYGFEQMVSGFPDLVALQRYHAVEFSPGGPLTMLRLLYSVVVIGPNLFYQTTLPAHMAAIAIAAHWILILASLLLCLRRIRTAEVKLKRLLAGGVIMLVIVVVVVVLIRARTPWHLAYAPSFALAFLYAVIATIAFRHDYNFKVRALFSTTIIILFLATAAGAGYKLYSNSMRFQKLVLYDVKNLKSPWGLTGLEIPAFSSKAHGDYLCQQAPVVLHGPYAAMVDAHVGIEAEMSCGKKNNILIGGTTRNSDFSHMTGITAEMSDNLGSKPYKQIGNVYFYQPLAVSDMGRAISLAEGNKNPPRPMLTGGNPEVQELELETKKPSALLASIPVGSKMALDIQQVTCNGAQAQLAIRSNYSWLYRCGESKNRTPMTWQVWYVSSAENMIDVVLLPVDQ